MIARLSVALLALLLVTALVVSANDQSVAGEAEVACVSAYTEAAAECERQNTARSGLRHACLERAELSYSSCATKPITLQSFTPHAINEEHAALLCEDACVEVASTHKYACEARRARDWDYCHATNDPEPTNYMPTKGCLRRSEAIESLCAKRIDNTRNGCISACGVTNSIHQVAAQSAEAPSPATFHGCLNECDATFARSIEQGSTSALDARAACQHAHRSRDVSPRPYAKCIDEVEVNHAAQTEAAEVWHQQCYAACEKKAQAASQREMALRAEELRSAAARAEL